MNYCMRNLYRVSDRAHSLYFRFRCILAVVYRSHIKGHGCSCLWSAELICCVVVREVTRRSFKLCIQWPEVCMCFKLLCSFVYSHLLLRYLSPGSSLWFVSQNVCKILAWTVGNRPVSVLRRWKHTIKMDLEDLNATGISNGELLSPES